MIHSWSPHDAHQPYGPDPEGLRGVIDELGRIRSRLRHIETDLADPDAPRRLVEYAVGEFGALDIVIANHARSSPGTLQTVSAEELDLACAVNARAVVLLAQAYAAHHDDARGDGRMVLFTSGQHLAPMTDEVPYAISKGAVHQMTRSLADAIAERWCDQAIANSRGAAFGVYGPHNGISATFALPA